MRSSLAVLLAAALLGAGAEAASAATVSATVTQNVDPGVPAKGVPPTMTLAASLRVNAPSGETNAMTVRVAGAGAVELEDSAVPPAAGPGCKQQSGSVVRCAVAGPLTVNATLGDGDDTWESGSLDARVNGGTGNDRIQAAGRIVGGEGDDTLSAATPTTVLDGGAGADRTSGGIVSYGGRREAVTVDLGGAGTGGGPGEGDIIENAAGVIGGGGDDVLLGGDRPDQLWGGAGVDRIDGRSGDDLLSGGRPPSNLLAGTQADGASPTADHPEQIAGGLGDDELSGTGQLDGGDGNDEVRGDGALLGGEGDDRLIGFAGGAVLDGGPGNDSVAEDESASTARPGLGSGPIVLSGGPGDDAIRADGVGGVPALLDGGDGNDTVWAGSIGDRGNAGPGNDTVRLIAGDTTGRVSCGVGRDLVEPSGVGNLARPDCERVRPFFGPEGDRITFPRRPKTVRRVARFRFHRTCGDLADIGATAKCLVRVELRSAHGRLLGLSSVRLHGGGAATVRVPLQRPLTSTKVAVRIHILGADAHGRQEALNGGWVAR
jgi:Ca2+-binding RTX toxin-like protein